MTLPVAPLMAASLGTPELGTRDPKRVAKLVGNSMALLNVAMIEMIALACFQPPQ